MYVELNPQGRLSLPLMTILVLLWLTRRLFACGVNSYV